MYLSKLEIRNFRNFEAADIPLAGNVVLLGKIVSVKVICFSQFDWLLIPLPDSARQLKLSDFWDGCDLESNPQIEVHLEFADFDSDPSLSALLTDFRIAEDPTVARLSYIFRKRKKSMGLHVRVRTVSLLFWRRSGIASHSWTRQAADLH